MQTDELPTLTDLEREIAARSEDSLTVFTREAFKHVDPVDYIHGRHIDMMGEYCEAFIAGEIPRLLINIPPGHMKSIECSVMLNAWCWTKVERASKRFMGIAYREPLALRDGLKTRNLIKSDWYQQRWGHIGGLREQAFTINKGQDKVTRFQNSEGGYRISGSLNAVMGEGGDFLIFDDPHNVMQAESDDVLEKQIELINLAIPTRVRSADGGVLVIMQRLRERDMSGDMIARGGDMVHLCLPARFEYDHPHVTVPKTLKSGRELPGDWRCDPEILAQYKELTVDDKDELKKSQAAELASKHNGKLLFPQLFSRKRLDEMLIYLGAYGEAGQFQQRPSPREGGMFQKGDFQVIDRLPEGPYIEARGWDLGATQGGGAYTAGVHTRYYWRTKQIVVVHVTRGQWSSLNVDKNMRQQAKLDGKRVIQDVPQDPGQAGKSQKRHIADNLKGFNVRFSPETGDKETRAAGLSSQAEAGNVYIMRGEWNQDFVDEADNFPTGTYKDQIDGWSRAYARILILMKSKKGKPVAAEVVEP